MYSAGAVALGLGWVQGFKEGLYSSRVHARPGLRHIEAPTQDAMPARGIDWPWCDDTGTPTWLALRVVSTTVSDRAGASTAILENRLTGGLRTVSVGDDVGGRRVVCVDDMRVVIDSSAGLPETISSGTGGPARRNRVYEMEGYVFRVHRELRRLFDDECPGNVNCVALQARIVPSFRDGRPDGFKLFSIRPDSIYPLMGFQNGDTIERINGHDLDSPDKALEVYSELRNASRIEVEFERAGRPMRHVYLLE
jgi:general secretion pathway protein C